MSTNLRTKEILWLVSLRDKIWATTGKYSVPQRRQSLAKTPKRTDLVWGYDCTQTARILHLIVIISRCYTCSRATPVAILSQVSFYSASLSTEACEFATGQVYTYKSPYAYFVHTGHSRSGRGQQVFSSTVRRCRQGLLGDPDGALLTAHCGRTYPACFSIIL